MSSCSTCASTPSAASLWRPSVSTRLSSSAGPSAATSSLAASGAELRHDPSPEALWVETQTSSVPLTGLLFPGVSLHVHGVDLRVPGEHLQAFLLELLSAQLVRDVVPLQGI